MEHEDGYEILSISTSRGEIRCRYYEAKGADQGVVSVGGTGGGFDSPAGDLYATLPKDLIEQGISSLRVQFRFPHDLAESTLDVLAGLNFLEEEGVQKAALIGHSLGGAVVMQAAATSSLVRTVVALSTQSYGAEAVTRFREGVSLLLIHGGSDPVLPSRCSSDVFGMAKEPKEIKILDDAGHTLNEVPDPVRREVLTWLFANLK